MERRRFKQTQSLEERLAEDAKRLRSEAKLLPRSAAREEALRRARQAETGSHMSEWLRSPGLANEYRAYIIGPDGHILQRVDLFCVDDDAAKERAKQLVNGHDIELWQLDRRIAEFKHER